MYYLLHIEVTVVKHLSGHDKYVDVKIYNRL